MTLILSLSVAGLKARPASCRLILNGAPLRTTSALEEVKSCVRCLCRFSDFSRSTCWMFKTAEGERVRRAGECSPVRGLRASCRGAQGGVAASRAHLSSVCVSLSASAQRVLTRPWLRALILKPGPAPAPEAVFQEESELVSFNHNKGR